MSQYLSMLPSQQMRLEQRLSPQLIQSMEILQLPLMALEARIREELESNPVLEEAEPEATPEEVKPPREELPATENNKAEAEGFERLERMARDMDLDAGDVPYGRASSGHGERDSKLEAMANTSSRGEGLGEQLLHQWSLVDAPAAVKSAGEAIIDWMDEDGYLRTEAEHVSGRGNSASLEARPLIVRRTAEETRRLMDEIALSRKPPIDAGVLARALELVQTLEPVGVGARDLTECLLIQLKLRPEATVDPLVEELVQHHLVALAKNMFPAVAKKTKRSIEDVRAALKVIGTLYHHPGLLVRPSHAPPITPDIIVDYADDGDDYTVRLARGNSPRLRISPQYREMLLDRQEDPQVREFIKQRLDAAGRIIDAIQFRRDRMLEIAKIILQRQREFFDYGPQFLVVLRMRDLAEELGCDASTISRTVDGKYLQTPKGLYPLRLFFTGGVTDGAGDNLSWTSVRARVKAIIDDEDKRSPLTDEQIAKLLNQSTSIPLARRTIAKYRAELGIPSNLQRRVY